MKPAPFDLHAPTEVDEVLDLLGRYGDDAKVLAGGQSLVPMLSLRLTRFDHLIDVNAVNGLGSVSKDDGWLRVGATTRHRVLEHDPAVAAAVPLLARATRQVGHFQIRNRGTVGGALAHADPAAEHPAVALALDAVMEVASADGRREIPAAEFFLGTWTTALEPGELLVGARFPTWSGRCGWSVQELARRHGDFAMAGVVCGLELGSGDRVERAALGLFGVSGTPVRARSAEEALVAGASTDEVAAAAVAGVEMVADLHASEDYRRSVTQVLVRRAVEEASKEAGRG